MGVVKRQTLQIGRLASGEEYYFFAQPIGLAKPRRAQAKPKPRAKKQVRKRT